MPIKPIPTGFHTITPFYMVKGADKFIAFLKKAFGAKSMGIHKMPNGKIMHAQLKIGDSMLMLGDACGPYPPLPMMVYLYVKDVDAVYKRALAAGAKTIQKPGDQFYGDRSGGVADKFGNKWWIGTHIENVSPKELERRALGQYKNPN